MHVRDVRYVNRLASSTTHSLTHSFVHTPGGYDKRLDYQMCMRAGSFQSPSNQSSHRHIINTTQKPRQHESFVTEVRRIADARAYSKYIYICIWKWRALEQASTRVVHCAAEKGSRAKGHRPTGGDGGSGGSVEENGAFSLCMDKTAVKPSQFHSFILLYFSISIYVLFLGNCVYICIELTRLCMNSSTTHTWIAMAYSTNSHDYYSVLEIFLENFEMGLMGVLRVFLMFFCLRMGIRELVWEWQ